MRYLTTIAGKEYQVEIVDERHVIVDGVSYQVDFEAVSDQPVYTLLVDGKSYDAHVYQDENVWQVLFHGGTYSVTVEDEREKRLRGSLGGGIAENQEYYLKAPMPGLVVSVPVSEGQAVQKGDVLLILESMKMQNELKSPRAGQVARVRVKPGDRVEHKETMLSVI